MIPKLNDLLQTEGKNWNDANNDLLLVSLMFDKEFDMLDQDFYHDMLGNDLYDYSLSKNDKATIIAQLKHFIDTNSSFAPTVAGVLGECNDDNIYFYLYGQLKDKYKLNPDLAIAILRSLNGRSYDGFDKLIVDIKDNKSLNSDLRIEADRIYSLHKNKVRMKASKGEIS